MRPYSQPDARAASDFPIPAGGCKSRTATGHVKVRAALFAWQHDPAGFLANHRQKKRRERGLVRDAVTIEPADLEELKAEQERRGLSEKHIEACQKHGAEWLKRLATSDLRHVTRAEVNQFLATRNGA